jgi:hypothetical protein
MDCICFKIITVITWFFCISQGASKLPKDKTLYKPYKGFGTWQIILGIAVSEHRDWLNPKKKMAAPSKCFHNVNIWMGKTLHQLNITDIYVNYSPEFEEYSWIKKTKN